MNDQEIFMTQRDKVLAEAGKLINKDRHNQYGEAQDNFEILRKNWADLLQCDLQLWQVPFMLAQMKIARIVNGGYKEDSIVDCIGYLAITSELKNISKL